MAPRTRLQAAPDRRVRYNGGSEAAHRQTATPTLTQPAAADRVTKERAPSRITRRGAAEAGSGISLAASIALHRRARATPIQRAPRPNRESRNQAAAPSPSTADKKSKADMKVCVLCIHEKRVTSFQPPKDMTVCQHFADICRSCVERTVRSRLGGAQLNDGDLNCVYTGCPTVIPYSKVKEMISPGLFESWDKALLKRQMDNDPNVIACLSSTCGQWFSIEGWSNACKRAKKISCPHCKSEQCIACTRPWHKGTACHSEANENQISDADRKLLQVQPCPGCGVEIKKEGGCNHMTCGKCRQQFCWLCLSLVPNHTETCAEYRTFGMYAAGPHGPHPPGHPPEQMPPGPANLRGELYPLLDRLEMIHERGLRIMANFPQGNRVIGMNEIEDPLTQRNVPQDDRANIRRVMQETREINAEEEPRGRVQDDELGLGQIRQRLEQLGARIDELHALGERQQDRTDHARARAEDALQRHLDLRAQEPAEQTFQDTSAERDEGRAARTRARVVELQQLQREMQLQQEMRQRLARVDEVRPPPGRGPRDALAALERATEQVQRARAHMEVIEAALGGQRPPRGGGLGGAAL